jgi:hypothetical protein
VSLKDHPQLVTVPKEQLDMLQGEVQQLRQQFGQAQAVLHQRSEPMLTAVLDALNQLATFAETPGHPANAVARDLLQKWVAANDRARKVVEGRPSIAVANGNFPHA